MNCHSRELPVHQYEANLSGRDFVVGDVHGMFFALEALLDKVAFDRDRDRLFSVGDLVDRGPDSTAILDWLEKPWFHCVRGNHEQFMLDCRTRQELLSWAAFNGGSWWLELSASEHERYRNAVNRLPYAIEIITTTETVGIVHAGVPDGMSWPAFKHALMEGDEQAMQTALWTRQSLFILETGGSVAPVAECDVVISGHTPISDVIDTGRMVYLDTGSVYTNKPWAALTLYRLHPDRGQYWRARTASYLKNPRSGVLQIEHSQASTLRAGNG